MQVDPIGYEGGINLYVYVGNDPLNLTDPAGRCPTCVVGGLLNVGIGYGIAKFMGHEYGVGTALFDFGVGFATSGVAVLSAARRGAQITEGIYMANSSSRLPYVGQSANISERLAQNVGAGRVTEEAARSATRFEVLGGQLSREVAEQRLINSSGGIPSLANQVNPIGGRMSLLNNPALGVISRDNLVNWSGVIAADVSVGVLTRSEPAYGFRSQNFQHSQK